jgi:hypothetical protein
MHLKDLENLHCEMRTPLLSCNALGKRDQLSIHDVWDLRISSPVARQVLITIIHLKTQK